MNSRNTSDRERRIVADILEERLTQYCGTDTRRVASQLATEIIDELIRQGYLELY